MREKKVNVNFDKLFTEIISDSDKQLILLILILLWREKADKTLLLALAFILLS